MPDLFHESAHNYQSIMYVEVAEGYRGRLTALGDCHVQEPCASPTWKAAGEYYSA